MTEKVVDVSSVGLTNYHVTRRSLLRLGAGVLGATAIMPLLAACGDDDTEEEEPRSGAAEPTAVSEEPEGEDTAEPEGATENAESGETPEAEGSPEEAGEPVYGGELIYGLSSDPPNLDPHVSTGTAARAVKLQVYNSLAQYGRDGTVSPSLAENWEISDDGMEYTFTLVEGVAFHDGAPFTAADVQASFERIQDEGIGATRFVEFTNISGMELDGDLSIRLMLDAPNASILEYFAHPETAIMSKGFLDAGGDPNLTMMGTGPFTFVEREPGVRTVVERNENYFREGLPYLDRIVFVPYPDENTRTAAVIGGDIHIADYVPWRSMQEIEDDPNLVLASALQSAFMCVIYNVREAPFDDPAVRHALGYAFDREAIVEAAFFGRAEPMTGGVIPPGSWAYAEDLEGTFSYDPDRASQLLEEAGYGEGLSVTLMSTSQYGMHQNSGEIVQLNLQDIGIDCELELFDWATVVQKHTDSDYQFRIQGTSGDSNDPNFFTSFFHSESANAQSNGFADEQIDEWLAEGRRTIDEDERKEIYRQIEERVLELSPWTWLVYRQDGEAVRATVHGYEHLPGPLGYFSGLTLQETWIDEG